MEDTARLKSLLEVAESTSRYSSDAGELKKEIVKSVLQKDNDLKIQKYKIDKMIESGLIKEQKQETISRNKLIEYGFALLKDNRFYIVLIFITVLFNSSRFWEYMFAKLAQ